MKKILPYLLTLTLALAMASCSSSRHAAGGGTTTTATDNAFIQRVMHNALTAPAVTAKMEVTASLGEQRITLGGTLRMKRDEVIQVNLTFLGIGVGTLEFAPDEVVAIDRINRRYAKGSYSQVDFLRGAGLDFYALQALFWSEIFVPGQKAPQPSHYSQFTQASSGDHTLLSLAAYPKLDYAFLANTRTALLNRTTVSPKDLQSDNNLVCKYDRYQKLGGQMFPTQLSITFTGSMAFGLDMSLSSLGTASDWTTRTAVSSKYKAMDFQRLLSGMMNQ